jgi:hypothetical protein
MVKKMAISNLAEVSEKKLVGKSPITGIKVYLIHELL